MTKASTETVVPSKGKCHRLMGEARDANTICILQCHPAASARCKSLDAVVGQVLAAGLGLWKAAVRMWRIARSSLRSRWTPTKPKAAEQRERRWSCVIVFLLKKFLCYSEAWRLPLILCLKLVDKYMWAGKEGNRTWNSSLIFRCFGCCGNGKRGCD